MLFALRRSIRVRTWALHILFSFLNFFFKLTSYDINRNTIYLLTGAGSDRAGQRLREERKKRKKVRDSWWMERLVFCCVCFAYLARAWAWAELFLTSFMAKREGVNENFFH